MPKTVLITGSSSGFGRASALRFLAGGWNVVATMREPAADTELDGRDGVLVTRLDVRDRPSIARAIDAGIARFGAIDAVVNNAGFGLHGIFEATPRERIEEQFAVNVFGVMDVTRAILPHFRKSRAGAIVNVSSGAGVFTLPMLSLYSASKHALEAFSESLSYELAPLGIRVKIVEPGGVTTTNFIQRSGAEPATNVTTMAMLRSANLAEALKRLARYKRLVCPEQITVDVASGGARRGVSSRTRIWSRARSRSCSGSKSSTPSRAPSTGGKGRRRCGGGRAWADARDSRVNLA